MQLTNIFMCSFKEGELTVDICEHLVLEQCVQICVLSLSFSSEKVKEAYFWVINHSIPQSTLKVTFLNF